MPGNSSRSTTKPASIWQLIAQCYVTMIITVGLGMLAAIPVIKSRTHYYSHATLVLGERPADDSQLTAWALSQPGIATFDTQRRGDDFWYRSEYMGTPRQQPPHPVLAAKMRELGYEIRGMHGSAGFGIATNLREMLTDPVTLATMLAGTQIAFGIVGMNRIRAARRRGEALPPIFPGKHQRALLLGALCGLGLISLGLLYEQALTALLGHAPSNPWDSSSSMSPQTQLIFLFFGGLGAPISEEIFFRGYVFGKFKQAGHVGPGVLFSALLFGAIHVSDPSNIPGICLFGVILAWLYHRTGSLVAPIAAHMVNNGLAILLLMLS